MTPLCREELPATAGLTLLYAAELRPSADDVACLIEKSARGHAPFSLVGDSTPANGTVELLASGLTFDLAGLAPAPSLPIPAICHRYGLDSQFGNAELAAIRLWPGPHLRGAERLLPVVRILGGIGARLAGLPGLRAVVWSPARTAMSGEAFVRAMNGWLGGGAFPALGLTAIATADDGRLHSEGLAFFTGQEIVLESDVGRQPRDGARIAVRLIDALVGAEPVRTPTHFTGPEGEALIADPDGDLKTVRISRAA